MMSDDDNDSQMIFGDLGDLKLPDICLIGEEKSRKNLTQEICPDHGSNQGPLHDMRACCRLAHSGGWWWCLITETSRLKKFLKCNKYYCKYIIGTVWYFFFKLHVLSLVHYINSVLYICVTNVINSFWDKVHYIDAAGSVGTSFLGEIFSEFFLSYKTNVGKL